MLRGISFLLLVFVSAAIADAQSRESAGVGRIDAYCKTVDAFVKRNKQPHVVVADVSNFEKSEPNWKRFGSTRLLEKYRRNNDVFNVAYNWRKNKMTIFSAVTLSSPSGDWAKYLYLCYRDDGTLARAKSELRTFYGDFAARQSFYFDRKGKLLRKTLAFSDLISGKPVKPPGSDLEENEPYLTETNYYKSTSVLPFARLLER